MAGRGCGYVEGGDCEVSKRFPIMGGPSLPWAMIEPYEGQAKTNHDQSLARLAGVGWAVGAVIRKLPECGDIRYRRRFAWLPIAMTDGQHRVWLRHYWAVERWEYRDHDFFDYCGREQWCVEALLLDGPAKARLLGGPRK